MRKLLVSIIAVTAMQTANAGGYHHHNHHRHSHHNGAQIALGIIGAAVITNAIVNQYRAPVIYSNVPQTVISNVTTNCLVPVFNPYTNTYENVVTVCNQPMVQIIR